MAGYAAELTRTLNTAQSLGSMTADATRPRRMKLFFFTIGCEGDPSNGAQITFRIRRCTTAGTSTAVTPQAMDPADAATESDVGENHSAEPTYTANSEQLTVPWNQRATYAWYATPGKEIVTPATASNGLGIETPAISTGTPVLRATIQYEEQ